MNDNSRQMIPIVVENARAKLREMVSEFVTAYPDVFRRGPDALLTRVPTAKDKRDLRKEIAGITDIETLNDALASLEKQTSRQEVEELLSGGRL